MMSDKEWQKQTELEKQLIEAENGGAVSPASPKGRKTGAAGALPPD